MSRLRSLVVIAVIAAAGIIGATLLPAGSALGAPVLLSQGKEARASSTENADYTPAANAVDGSAETRWSSRWGNDDEWLQVDLGQQSTLDRVELLWESAYAKAYEIQVSDKGDGGWRTIHTESAGDGGTDSFAVSGSGRFVRFQGVTRAGGYGYSLWEMKIFGEAGSPEPTATPTASPTPEPSSSPAPGGPVDPGFPNEAGPLTGASVVDVVGGDGSWQLRVNDKPYTVKGFTWGPAFSEADKYMPGLNDIGANTIRTWGTGADTRQLLDSAATAGIRVVNGFWLLPGGGPGSGGCIEYTKDTAYKAEALADIVKWVETYKSHPAVLMWNVGNESVLGLQNCFSGADLEAQRIAYARFVNDVTKEIHRVDPDHPVTSTDAWTGAWDYFRDYAPDLDLLAVNSYGDVCNIRSTWEAGGYDKPYIVTEGGAAGEWEVPDDANGVPDEPTDLQKGRAYVDSWQCITEHKGVGLGATFFHYGTEGNFGGVWFNVIPGGNKRLGYYSIASAWGMPKAGNTPPKITSMAIEGSASIVAGKPVDIDISASDPDGDDLKYVTFINSKYIDGSGDTQFVEHTRVDADTLRITAPQKLGVWKAYVFVEDGQGNVGVETKSFRVVPPTVAGTNVALGKDASASSFQTSGGDYTPGRAFDGNTSTRWSSEWGATAFIQVDLGAPTAFDRLQLVWENAFAKSYTVQTSDDGKTWTDLKKVTDGDGFIDDVAVNATARWVRLELTERGLPDYGYSLFELGIYQTD